MRPTNRAIGLSPRQAFLKRTIDICGGLVLLLLLGWLIALLVAIARWDTGSSGLYRQERIGQEGQPFLVLKIRTMRPGSDAAGSTTAADDPRVTRVGSILRRYKLDELPQLINVLVGEMSLVGPRPTTPDDHQRMTEQQRRRAAVRPGVTGLAQLSGNTSLSWPERVELDLHYIDNWSVGTDIGLMLRTMGGFLRGALHTDPAGSDEWL